VPLESPGFVRFDPGGTSHALSVGGGLEGPAAIVASTTTLLIGTLWVLLVGGPGS
jgi:hypothetical protein